MSVVASFAPLGNTVTVTAATTYPAPVQATSTLSAIQYRVINAGNVTAFLGVGSTGANANSNAVVVTSSQGSVPLLPGTDEVLSFTANAFFTAITSSGTAVLYITPGDGM